jgi:hypothetical protein
MLLGCAVAYSMGVETFIVAGMGAANIKITIK